MAATKRRTRRHRTRPARKARRKPSRPRPARRKKARALPKKARRKAITRRRQTATRKPAARKPAATKAARSRPQARKAAPRAAGSSRRGAAASLLDRSRRQLPDAERMARGSGTTDEHMLSAARSGHDEMRIRLQKHTDTSPALTGGDPDARWEDAAAVGDEAPGGDNPTPDQDRVDDIGKALGIQYRTDEELQGGDEVAARDRRRWELDPASSEDWPHDKKKR